jgi:hypothetical protein
MNIKELEERIQTYNLGTEYRAVETLLCSSLLSLTNNGKTSLSVLIKEEYNKDLGARLSSLVKDAQDSLAGGQEDIWDLLARIEAYKGMLASKPLSKTNILIVRYIKLLNKTGLEYARAIRKEANSRVLQLK